MPRIKAFKRDGKVVSWMSNPLSIAECKDLMKAVDQYTEALGREIGCKHRWTLVGSGWMCTICGTKQ